MAPRRSERLRKMREAMNSSVRNQSETSRTIASNSSRAARRAARARRANRPRRARPSRAAQVQTPIAQPRAIFGGMVHTLRFVQESHITWLHLETLPPAYHDPHMGPDELLVIRVLSLFVRIALVESPSLAELTRRNPNQGIRKLIRIIRFLFFRY